MNWSLGSFGVLGLGVYVSGAKGIVWGLELHGVERSRFLGGSVVLRFCRVIRLWRALMTAEVSYLQCCAPGY